MLNDSLTSQPPQTLFAKLTKYVGPNLVSMIDRPSDPYCFRLREWHALRSSGGHMARAVGARGRKWSESGG